jgi:hypothetical protein
MGRRNNVFTTHGSCSRVKTMAAVISIVFYVLLCAATVLSTRFRRAPVDETTSENQNQSPSREVCIQLDLSSQWQESKT